MKHLIIGLGNVGVAYEHTRHNIGFKIVDALLAAELAVLSDAYQSRYARLSYPDRMMYVVKPSTSMNLSGKAVSYWLRKLHIPVENMLVVVDDLALPLGTLRLKPTGGAGGHNGLKNITEVLGHPHYPRLRVGISAHFPKGGQNDYVLSPFDPNELTEVPVVIDRAVNMIKSFVCVGLELTMTRFN